RVRMVDTSGVITTIAGTGINGYSGDGGPPLKAQLFFAFGLAWDPSSGRLLVADRANGRVRAIVPGTSINTIAGNDLCRHNADKRRETQAFFFGSAGLATDSAGNLYVADSVIWKITPSGLIQKAFGIEGVSCSNNCVSSPRGLTLAANGDLIIADRGS